MRAVLLLTAALIAACAPGSPHESGPPSPAAAYRGDPAAIERGRLLFVSVCSAYCHRMDASVSEAPDLFDCQWLHGGSDLSVFTTISKGVPGTLMIDFGGKLPEGDDDIWKLVAFLKSRSRCQSPP